MSADDGTLETEVRNIPELSDRARVIGMLPVIEQELYAAKYPNLKMVGNIASGLRRDFLDPEHEPRPKSPERGLDAPRDELMNFVTEWLVLDMQRLGMVDVLTALDECAFRFDRIRGISGIGTSQEADRLVAGSISEAGVVFAERQGQQVDPNEIIAEGARRAADRTADQVDKPLLAQRLNEFNLGLADLLRKGRWWDTILENPTA